MFSTQVLPLLFVADQRLYDTVYQERYMNTPQNNPEGYRKGSPISYAAGLKGNLLLIHGTGDDNVHYQNCEMLVNELVRHGKNLLTDFLPDAFPWNLRRQGNQLASAKDNG